MAKIPTGDFGQVRAQAAPTQTPSAREIDGGLGDALQGLGNTGMNIAGAQLNKERKAEAEFQANVDATRTRDANEQAAAEKQAARELAQAQKREAEKQAARAEQIQHLTATADIQNGLADSLEEINVRVASGATKKDDARKEFAAASEKVVANSLANLPPDFAPLVEAQMRGLRGQLTNKLEDGIRKRDNQEADAGLVKYGEQMQRLAQTDPALAIKQHSGAVQALGPAAGWTPEQIAKTDQAFKEKVLYTNSLAVVHAARGNIKALDQAGQVINQRGDLDPKAKESLLNQVSLEKERIIAANQRAQATAVAAEDLRLRKAGIAMAAATKLGDYGTLDDKTMGDLIKTTSGTIYAPQVKQLFETQRITGALTGQPVAAVKNLLEQLHTDVAVNKINPEKAQRIEQVTKVLRGQEADIKSMGALEAAQKHNAPGVGVIEPINMSSVETISAGVQKRADQVAYADKWSGKNSSFFKTGEAESIGKTLAALAPNAKSAFIGMLSKTIPPKKMIALAEQIGDSDKGLSLQISLAADKTTEGRFASEILAKGVQAVKDKSVKLDSIAISGTRGQMAKYIGDSLVGKVREDVLDAATYIYLGHQSEGSSANVERAVRLAAGGPIIERNKLKVVIPAGLDETTFETALVEAAKRSTANKAVIIRGQSIPAEELIKAIPGAELKPLRKGVYGVIVGNAPVMRDEKNRLELEVGNVAP